MPRIKIKRDDKIEQLYVDDSTLQQVLDKIDDKDIKSNNLITVGDINFIKKDFKGFTKDNDPVLSEGYDLSNTEHRAQIEEFGKMLEDLKKTSVLQRPLDYYGNIPKTINREGIVHNPILGITHWSEVDYAEKIGVIGRYPQGNWFVALDPGMQKQMAAARNFDRFNAKRKALSKMKDFEYQKNRDEQTRIEGVDF